MYFGKRVLLSNIGQLLANQRALHQGLLSPKLLFSSRRVTARVKLVKNQPLEESLPANGQKSGRCKR